jgi:hypothetical protein
MTRQNEMDIAGMQDRLARLEARQEKLQADARRLAERRQALEGEIRVRQAHQEVQEDFDERMLLGALVQSSGLADHFRLSSGDSSGNQRTTIDVGAVSGALRLLNEQLRDAQRTTSGQRDEAQGFPKINQGEM